MDDGSDYVYLYDDEEFVETDRPGFRRRIVNGDGMQLCFWRISGGAKGSFMHNHEEHEQLGIVIRGGLEFRIGDSDTGERRVLGPGDVYLAPKGVWHGDSGFVGDEEYGECWILDIFAPPRDDLRQSE